MNAEWQEPTIQSTRGWGFFMDGICAPENANKSDVFSILQVARVVRAYRHRIAQLEQQVKELEETKERQLQRICELKDVNEEPCGEIDTLKEEKPPTTENPILRDQFAMAALPKVMDAWLAGLGSLHEVETTAYKIADAMMKARKEPTNV